MQEALADAGVTGDVQRELYQRRDITPQAVEQELADIRRSKNIDDPAAVLVHRLRQKRFDHNNNGPRKLPNVQLKKID